MNAQLLSRIETLGRESRDGDPWTHARTCIELDVALDAAVMDAKPALLASGNWNSAERAVVTNLRHAKEQLAAVGSSIAARCEREHAEGDHEALLRQVIATSLANHGSSAKWCAALRDQPREGAFARVHALYRMAERLACLHAAAGPLVREGVSRTLTPEAFYLRAMILPQVCAGGGLDPDQIEIFDSWLWTWVRDYRLTRTHEAGEPPAWIDLASDDGVCVSHFVPEGGDLRFLVTSRMTAQLAEVIGGFHAGQVYPGFGLSTQMRIDSHVALLDRLTALWDRTLEAATPSVPGPSSLEQRRIEAFVGIPETLMNAFAKGETSLSIESARPHAALASGSDPVQEVSRRWVRVQEDTGTFMRMAVDATLWDPVSPGELIGVRAEGDALPSVGVVSRKFVTRDASGTQVEVKWLARGVRKVLLRECQVAGTAQVVNALYAPGSDSCGRFDCLIVPEATFARDARYELSLADQIYVVRLNRVRHQGRGWIAAGLEVEETRGRAAAPPVLRVA